MAVARDDHPDFIFSAIGAFRLPWRSRSPAKTILGVGVSHSHMARAQNVVQPALPFRGPDRLFWYWARVSSWEDLLVSCCSARG